MTRQLPTLSNKSSDSNGWICVPREVFTSPLFEGEEYSRREAWLYLVSRANHETKEVMIGADKVTVKRGQFVTSIVKLSERFGWSRTKVDRFLEGLKCEHQIVHETCRWGTIVTICTYELYNRTKESGRATNEQQTVHKQEYNILYSNISAAPLSESERTSASSSANLQEEPSSATEDPEQELIAFAESQLSIPTPGAEWMNDPRYVSIGRRPLKKYPNIWLSVQELIHVLKIYSNLQNKELWLKQAIQLVDGRLRDRIANGDNISRVSCYTWLIGWAYTEVQKQSLNEARAAKYGGIQ